MSFRHLLRMACVIALATASFGLLLVGSSASGASAAAANASGPSCGISVEDKLAAARHALQGKGDNESTRAAVQCLLEAVVTLNDKSAVVKRGAAAAIAVPVYQREPNKP